METFLKKQKNKILNASFCGTFSLYHFLGGIFMAFQQIIAGKVEDVFTNV